MLIEKYRTLSIILFLLIALPIAWLAATGISMAGLSTCQKCQVANGNALNVSFSELHKNPESFANKIIRVDAVLSNDAGYIFLHDPNNSNSKILMPAGFGKEFASCPATEKAMSFHSGVGTWYDGQARSVVIGKYGIIDDRREFHTGQMGLTLLCVETVKPINSISSVPINTIRYAMGRIGRLIFFH